MSLSIYAYKTLKNETIVSNWNYQVTISNDIFFEKSKYLGLSIKSQLESSSKSLNASEPINFTYKLSKKLNEVQIDKIKAKSNVSEKFVLLQNFGVDLDFDKIDNKIFNINLQTIDYNFNKLLSDILIFYYRNNKSKLNSVKYYVQQLTNKNEFNYNLSLNQEIYQMMMKKFLVDYVLGMRANEVWKRKYPANGGYLVVQEDGEILYYHFYFMKYFENYLFDNTRLETPSSSIYKMAEIYEEDNMQKMKLNLQIRFTK